MACQGKVMTFPVEPLPNELLVDTNGAGDSFCGEPHATAPTLLRFFAFTSALPTSPRRFYCPHDQGRATVGLRSGRSLGRANGDTAQWLYFPKNLRLRLDLEALKLISSSIWRTVPPQGAHLLRGRP